MKQIVLFAGLLVMLAVGGCHNNQAAMSEKQSLFAQNSLLSKEQRVFADRLYVHITKTFDYFKDDPSLAEIESLEIPDEFFQFELYKKWGLGEKRDFSTKEKYYLTQLHAVEESWQIYSQVDMKNLSDQEKQFLEKVHADCGQGPVNYREETRKIQGQLDKHQQMWFDLIEATTGNKELTDRDLIVVYRMAPR